MSVQFVWNKETLEVAVANPADPVETAKEMGFKDWDDAVKDGWCRGWYDHDGPGSYCDQCDQMKEIVYSEWPTLRDFIQWIINEGVDINQVNKSGGGRTIAFSLAREGLSDCLSLLADNGADFSIINDDGNTALNLAIRYQHWDCVEIIYHCLSGSNDFGDSRKLFEDMYVAVMDYRRKFECSEGAWTGVRNMVRYIFCDQSGDEFSDIYSSICGKFEE